MDTGGIMDQIDVDNLTVGDKVKVVAIRVPFPDPGPIEPIAGEEGIVVQISNGEIGFSRTVIRVEFKDKPYGIAESGWPFYVDEIRGTVADLWSELELQ